MQLSRRYLRGDVIAEPLVNRWYAWCHLISPATAAMLTVNLHSRLLESFLSHPELHRRALNESAMRGGMVLNYSGDNLLVHDLLRHTRSAMHCRFEFAQAVHEAQESLLSRPEPLRLDECYAQLPSALRGMVELVYDLQHRPQLRLIEPIAYLSPLHDESLQSLSLSINDGDQRPFALSTPRFSEASNVNLRAPFRSEWIDHLFASRRTPVTPALEDRLLQLVTTENERTTLDRMFTDECMPLLPSSEFPTEGVRARYFGHATVLLQSRRTSVLLDPLVSYFSSTERPPRFTLDDLPERIDYVLITHVHQDHLCIETLLQLRSRIGTVVVPRCSSGSLQDPSIKLMLKSIGFERVIELDELESLPVPGGDIMGIPFLGEHADLDIRAKLAYAVRLENRTLVFLADSNALAPEMYERIAHMVKPIDALYVGLECDGAPLSWLYGPLFTRPLRRAVDQSRRLNSSDAASAGKIVAALAPDRVFIYAMGLEPWLNHVSSISYTPQSRPIVESDRLIQACLANGRPAERLFMSHELTLS